MSNAKKPKKMPKQSSDGITLEAVKKLLTNPGTNKWKDIKKAMPTGYAPPENELEAMQIYANPPTPSIDFLDDEDSIPDSQIFKLEPPKNKFITTNDNLYPPPADNIYAKMKMKSQQFGELKTKEPEHIEVDFRAEDCEEAPPSNENDVDIIRNSLIIERIPDRMKIIAVVVDTENKSGNDINLIKCNGDPLGCFAYDAQHDGYYVHCAGYFDLGAIPVAYRIKSQGQLESNNVIALPDELIEKYFAPQQKKAMKIFREKFPSPRFSMQYMQVVTC